MRSFVRGEKNNSAETAAVPVFGWFHTRVACLRERLGMHFPGFDDHPPRLTRRRNRAPDHKGGRDPARGRLGDRTLQSCVLSCRRLGFVALIVAAGDAGNGGTSGRCCVQTPCFLFGSAHLDRWGLRHGRLIRCATRVLEEWCGVVAECGSSGAWWSYMAVRTKVQVHLI